MECFNTAAPSTSNGEPHAVMEMKTPMVVVGSSFWLVVRLVYNKSEDGADSAASNPFVAVVSSYFKLRNWMRNAPIRDRTKRTGNRK